MTPVAHEGSPPSNDAILLVGAGGHARACIDVIELALGFVVGGLVGLERERGESVLGHRVIGVDAELADLARQFRHALVTLGQIKSPDGRIRLFEQLASLGFDLPRIVSPRGYVSPSAELGTGTIVMHGAIVNAAARVGRNCIINSQALVEHDAHIADHCHIATNASVNSGVRVGAGTFIGSGAVVRQGLTIGERCVIGMGVRVLADCPAGTRLPPRTSAP